MGSHPANYLKYDIAGKPGGLETLWDVSIEPCHYSVEKIEAQVEEKMTKQMYDLEERMQGGLAKRNSPRVLGA